MKLLKSLNFLLLLSVLIISSCNKDDDITTTPTVPGGEIMEVMVTASINGAVIDEDQNPMADVSVQVGSNSAVTDAFGVFTFNNIQVDKNGAVVYIEKNGYYNNSKNVLSNNNNTSFTKIMLIEKVITSTFNATNGGTTNVTGGAKVVFPAEAVQLENGGSYTGNVNVYATWLDPTADDLSWRMPGDLRANTAGGEDAMLETYGMIGVELEGDSGESLNIAEGQTATIEVTVPAALLSSAPATIPLWHFDEVTGYWVEEGEATLTGNKYIGTVTHFSFWNFDVPYSLVHIEGTMVDQGQNSISNLSIEISMNSTGVSFVGYTDSDGIYQGYVPQGEPLTITVYGNCWDQLYTGQIGPFSADAVVPAITIDQNAGSVITITGTLQDCNNAIEENGYVWVEYGQFSGNSINVNADGNFSGTINVCDELEVTISGISIDPFSQGTSTVHDISGVTELNVGTLITCW